MTTFDITPDKFQHWDFSLDAEIATLTLTVDPAAATFGTYELKLNSYDIGVDIELANAIRHIRLSHPAVKCVVITSGCLLYTSPSPRDRQKSRMPSSA